MFAFLKSLFVRKQVEPLVSPRSTDDPVFPDEVENDPVMREVILRAIRSGNVVIGNRHSDGSVTIKEIAD